MKKLYIAVLLLAILFMSSGCPSFSQSPSPGLSPAKLNVPAIRELTHLAIACHLYAQKNNGMFPSNLADVQTYIQGPCDINDYTLVASGKLQDIDDTSKAILIRKKGPLPNGKQVVIYVDGHTDTVPMNETLTMGKFKPKEQDGAKRREDDPQEGDTGS